MHVGIDIHGVVDLYPEIFSKLSHQLIERRHIVSIITGQEWDKAKKTVELHNIIYSNSFSIVDHHRKQGTPMWQNSDGSWQMDDQIWCSSKGLYCMANHVDIHFDDSVEYAEYVPDFCTFILVPKKNFQKMFDMAGMM